MVSSTSRAGHPAAAGSGIFEAERLPRSQWRGVRAFGPVRAPVEHGLGEDESTREFCPACSVLTWSVAAARGRSRAGCRPPGGIDDEVGMGVEQQRWSTANSNAATEKRSISVGSSRRAESKDPSHHNSRDF